MTTPLNTITALLPHLTADQLQTIEAYTAWFYRQNLAAQIAALPNASLAGVGLYINMIASPKQFITIPPPPQIENPVPTQFLPELPPTPETHETHETHDRDLLPPLSLQYSRNPQLKSPTPDEPCSCFNCVASQDCQEDMSLEEDDYYNYEDDHRSGGCRSGYTW
jgi:hypothetical protein